MELDAIIPQLKAHIERMYVTCKILNLDFEVARREKRKKAAEDEEGRKRRRLEGEGNGDVSIRTNGDDGDTEVEKNSEDGESADERDEHDDHDDAEADLEDAEGEDEPEVGAESLGIIDMEEHDEKSDGGESDEALAEDSD